MTDADNPFDPAVAGAGSTSSRVVKLPDWIPITPVPKDAGPPFAEHPKLGKPSVVWTYRDAVGALLGHVYRFETKDGKEIRPLTFCRPRSGRGRAEWRWESWSPKRPLYGLDKLAARPDAPVVVVEGEKAADAATILLPDHAVITSLGGSKAAGKADWSPLCGRHVTVWPDADTAGERFAADVGKEATKAGAFSVYIGSPPEGSIQGWDAADAVEEGWTVERAAALIEAAATADRGHAAGGTQVRRRAGPTHKDALLKIVQKCDLWHDSSSSPYASMTVGERAARGSQPTIAAHREHWSVTSKGFRRWLAYEFEKETGAVPSGTAIEDILRVIEARAINEGLEHEPAVRVGSHDGHVYIDLGNPEWAAIEIGPTHSRVVASAPIKFLRPSAMRPLPEPEYPDDERSPIEDLRGLINIPSNDHFVMAVGFLVAAWRPPDRPYPLLAINGERGTGKSIMSSMFSQLIDPTKALNQAAAVDEHNLFIRATNGHLLAFDNMSTMPLWFSDALCRLSTGGTFAKRQLHTDTDEILLWARKPAIINGIPVLTEQPDLAERTLAVTLEHIPGEARRSERDLWARYHDLRPQVMGQLCNAVSAALKGLDRVSIEKLPRMADFVQWVTAAEPALGWEEGTFAAAYQRNQRALMEESFQANPFAVAVFGLITKGHTVGWEGTASELLPALEPHASEPMRKLKSWPNSPQRIGTALRRTAPLLRDKGISVEQRARGAERGWRIMPIPR
jgi:putative DNA primase/helicase